MGNIDKFTWGQYEVLPFKCCFTILFVAKIKNCNAVDYKYIANKKQYKLSSLFNFYYYIIIRNLFKILSKIFESINYFEKDIIKVG